MTRPPLARLIAVVIAAAAMAGCSNLQAAGDQLLRELPAAYPSQIAGIGFENYPPMDPPTLFIDLASSMDATAQLRFCATRSCRGSTRRARGSP
jgi:hypothetical protein